MARQEPIPRRLQLCRRHIDTVRGQGMQPVVPSLRQQTDAKREAGPGVHGVPGGPAASSLVTQLHVVTCCGSNRLWLCTVGRYLQADEVHCSNYYSATLRLRTGMLWQSASAGILCRMTLCLPATPMLVGTQVEQAAVSACVYCHGWASA